MSQSIYKYVLETTDEQKIDLPKGAKILSVQTQQGVNGIMNKDRKVLSVQIQKEAICVWALVDIDTKETDSCAFFIYGTGHPVPEEDLQGACFLGTVQLRDGTLVFHVFAKFLPFRVA